MRVATYSKTPVYRLGAKLDILYNPTASDQCIFNTFEDKWKNALWLLASASLILAYLPVYWFYYRHKQ
jgi:hypothetical protein